MSINAEDNSSHRIGYLLPRYIAVRLNYFVRGIRSVIWRFTETVARGGSGPLLGTFLLDHFDRFIVLIIDWLSAIVRYINSDSLFLLLLHD